MRVIVEVDDDVVAKLITRHNKVGERIKDRWDRVKHGMWSSHDIVISEAQVLLRWFTENRLKFVEPGQGDFDNLGSDKNEDNRTPGDGCFDQPAVQEQLDQVPGLEGSSSE